MANLEQQSHRPEQDLAQAPMDGDSGQDGEVPDLRDVSGPAIERSSEGQVTSVMEQQARNSDIMRALDD